MRSNWKLPGPFQNDLVDLLVDDLGDDLVVDVLVGVVVVVVDVLVDVDDRGDARCLGYFAIENENTHSRRDIRPKISRCSRSWELLMMLTIPMPWGQFDDR